MNEDFPGWVHVISPATFYLYAKQIRLRPLSLGPPHPSVVEQGGRTYPAKLLQLTKYTCIANITVKCLDLFLEPVTSLQLLMKSSEVRKTRQISVFSLCIKGDQSSAFEEGTVH